MYRNSCFAAPRKLLAATALTLAAPLSAQAMVTYDFAWWSGASQEWVYEAGSKLFVDLYEDSSASENAVLFRFRNNIDTELGYLSSILDLQIDTGINVGMFASVGVHSFEGYVSYQMHPPGDPLDLIDLSAARIAWDGDYAAGGLGSSSDKTNGINPGESLTLKAVLNDGYSFNDVVTAANVGMSAAYEPGHFGQWTTAQKQNYRAGAADGLRFAIMVHSIVPNSWHPDGHGLFMTHDIVAAPVPEAETWAMMLAGLGLLALVARRRKAETFRCL